MNQQIQIQDGFEQEVDSNSIVIKAYLGPVQIYCIVTDIGGDPAKFYQQAQFDIEEALTDLIDNQAWDDSERIYLSAKLL